MPGISRFLLCISIINCVLGLHCLGQEFRGTIAGRVADAQDAVVPNVRIVATRVETGAKYETVSGADGQYTLPFVAPGQYRLVAEAGGFKRYVREGLGVSTNEHLSADIHLELGQLTESVTVVADSPMLETGTASVGQVINARQIESMPMNGRSPFIAAQLSFGVAFTGDPSSRTKAFDNSRQSAFTMGGAPSGKNEFLWNGTPDTDSDGLVAYVPPLDAVVEVKVQTFQADAAYGNSGGGTLLLLSKSGTNDLHGTAYEFNAASALAATPFFTNSSGQRKGVARYNQFGVTVGGPVIIPKVIQGRNKVFFFFTYEQTRILNAASNILTVPTAAEHNGDFSQLLGVGSNYQMYDPLTGVRQGSRVQRLPFLNNIIPASRQNAVGNNILSYYLMPNVAGRPDGGNNFIDTTPSPDDYHGTSARVDFNLTNSQKLFFDFRNNNRLFGAPEGTFHNISTGTRNNENNWGSMLDYVYTIRPTVVLNTRVSWNRKGELRGIHSEGFDFTKLGFPASLAQASPKLAFPVIGLTPFVSVGTGQAASASTPSRLINPYDIYQLFSSVTKMAGSHTVKFGGDLRLSRYSLQSFANSAGLYTFGTSWANGPLDNSPAAPQGQEVAALLLGLPTGGNMDVNAGQTIQSPYYALFLQDDFHASTNLTLNLGIRYERQLTITERYNRMVNGFDFGATNPINPSASAAYNLNPIPEIPAGQFRVPGGLLFASSQNRNLYDTGAHYVSPRFGFAWKPAALGGKTVIRGGSGVFFFPITIPILDQPGFGQSTPLVPTLDGFLTPNVTLSNPFPSGLLPPTGSSLGLATNAGRNASFTTPTRLNGYSIRWQLNMQRELPGNTVLEIGYLGNHALHLAEDRNLNFVPAQYLSNSPTRDQATVDRLTANVTNPFAGLLPGTNLNGSTVQRQQLLEAYPEFTGVLDRSTPEGNSYYHTMQVRVEKRFSHDFQLLGNYSWSKLIERQNRLNDSNALLSKVISADDRSQRLVFSGNWDFPFGKGKAFGANAGRLVNRLISGWNLNAIYTRQGGAPLGSWGNVIYYGGDLHLRPRGVNGAFDTTRFDTNSKDQLQLNFRQFPLRFGNLRADGLNNVDFSAIKNTRIIEKLNLQYRCEFFNGLNHPAFNPPILTPTSSSFGLITGQLNSPRSIQMALKLIW